MRLMTSQTESRTDMFTLCLSEYWLSQLRFSPPALLWRRPYRWTDAEGTVHYSDRPTDGAEQIYLPESTRGTRPYARPTAITATADDIGRNPSGPFSYESIEVSAPGPEETLWNIGGVLNVSLNVQPSLQAWTSSPSLFRRRSEPGLRVELPDSRKSHRGVHNIQAEVLDENGQLMGRSQPNRFYVQQNSIAN